MRFRPEAPSHKPLEPSVLGNSSQRWLEANVTKEQSGGV
jgi:hypothetical protein